MSEGTYEGAIGIDLGMFFFLPCRIPTEVDPPDSSVSLCDGNSLTRGANRYHLLLCRRLRG